MPPMGDEVALPSPSASVTRPSSPTPSAPSSPSTPTSSNPTSSTPPAPTLTPLPPTPTPTRTHEGTPVPIRVESRVADHPTDQFRATAAAILDDSRGWQRAGFVFVLDDEDAPYRLVLAEGDEVDELCWPLDTGAEYSCQNGPVVALNADRWRTATSSWTGTLEEYRTMLVNHEVGHLLHLHHPLPQCPGPGLPAPVMMQQSSEVGECVANPWPLQWEVELAAQQAEPLAPPAEHDVSDHRPSPPAASS